MNTIADIINTLGGNAEVARMCSKTPSWASECKRRGSIPVEYWPRLIEVAHERGISLSADVLMRVHFDTQSN